MAQISRRAALLGVAAAALAAGTAAAPAFALVMAAICFVALVVYNPVIFAIFLVLMGLAVLAAKGLATPDPVAVQPISDPVP